MLSSTGSELQIACEAKWGGKPAGDGQSISTGSVCKKLRSDLGSSTYFPAKFDVLIKEQALEDTLTSSVIIKQNIEIEHVSIEQRVAWPK